MFRTLFDELRQAKVPVSLTEYLDLFNALDAGLANFSVNDFYYLSRAVMVKDEQNFDRFDRAFSKVFKGLSIGTDEDDSIEIPAEWLEKLGMLTLTDEEKAEIEALGGWDKLMETLQQRLNEQKKRHEGGTKMIGTRGTSPFGAYGYNPEGVRIGQEGNRNFRAVKVWDRRDFKDLDGSQELGTRNFKVALRRLRRFAREGAHSELDLEDTIRSTARNAGWLDLRMVPERHNAVKVLLLLDVGGSMDSHIRTCEALFSAARAEFKHLEHYYFHNCVYESVWRENRRRRTDANETMQLMHAYGSDYKLIFVGDAYMSPYEVNQPGGSVEHMNAEPGAVWLKRLLDTYPSAAWLNPIPEEYWRGGPSIQMIQRLMEGRMYPLSVEGIDAATRALAR